MLALSQFLFQAIQGHGVESYPYEGCGLLLGLVEDGRNRVEAIHPLPNVWPVEAERRVRFRIAEDDWRDAELAAVDEGLDIVGIFHSHPDTEPIASPRDLAWATWPGYSYLITQVDGGEARHSRSWQLADDRSHFVEEEIEIVE